MKRKIVKLICCSPWLLNKWQRVSNGCSNFYSSKSAWAPWKL